MFLSGSINLVAYTDTNQTQFPQQIVTNITQSLADSSATAQQSVFLNLAASASQSINLNGLTNVDRFYLYSDTTNLTLTINGSATTFTLKAGVPGFFPLALTSMTLVNASGTTATNVTFIPITG